MMFWYFWFPGLAYYLECGRCLLKVNVGRQQELRPVFRSVPACGRQIHVYKLIYTFAFLTKGIIQSWQACLLCFECSGLTFQWSKEVPGNFVLSRKSVYMVFWAKPIGRNPNDFLKTLDHRSLTWTNSRFRFGIWKCTMRHWNGESQRQRRTSSG